MKTLLAPFFLLVTWGLLPQSKVDGHKRTIDFRAVELGSPIITKFSPEQYNAHSQNWNVLQDDQGLIYVANGDAILQYDGVTWRKLELPELNRICTLVKDDKNRIFVGADSEIGYLDFDELGEMKYVSLLEKIPEAHRHIDEVWEVFIKNGQVLFRSNNKFYKWDGDRFKVLVSEYPVSLAYQVEQEIYLSSPTVGLLKLSNADYTPIPGAEIIKDSRVRSILPYDDKTMLISTRNDGMFLFDGTSFEHFSTEIDDYLKEFLLYKGTKIQNEYVFATLNGGLVFMDQNGRKIRTITEKSGF